MGCGRNAVCRALLQQQAWHPLHLQTLMKMKHSACLPASLYRGWYPHLQVCACRPPCDVLNVSCICTILRACTSKGAAVSTIILLHICTGRSALSVAGGRKSEKGLAFSRLRQDLNRANLIKTVQHNQETANRSVLALRRVLEVQKKDA